MQKRKLQLRDLITDKKLNEMRKAYQKPLMSREEAYQKVQVITDYLEVLKSFKFNPND